MKEKKLFKIKNEKGNKVWTRKNNQARKHNIEIMFFK